MICIANLLHLYHFVCVCVCVGGDSWFVPFYGVVYSPVQSLWVVTFELINPQRLQLFKCILNMLRCIVGFGDYPMEQLDGDAKKLQNVKNVQSKCHKVWRHFIQQIWLPT